jgi:heptosyltransferase-1
MPPRILIVRTSSLGDMVHVLPAISDIARCVPGARMDWVAEESFAEIPAWHPAIGQVIPMARRRWRKAWWSEAVRRERRALRERLRDTPYDVVLDMQGLLKSVWLGRQAQGVRHGLDWRSAREPLASLFYDVRHRVKFWQPAVTAQRELAALTFGYPVSGPPDFGLQALLDRAGQPQPAHPACPSGYAVIMPSASRDNKLWPAEHWRQVLQRLRNLGCELRLLAGNEQEAARARDLARDIEHAEVLPRMDRNAVAQVLAGARLMVGLDSGLTHLSAALGRPTVGIYRASSPVRAPVVGLNFTASLGERGAPPLAETVLTSVEQAFAAG